MTDPVSSTPAARPAASGLAERIADNLTRFTAALHQHPYWHLLPAGEHELARSTGVFDARAGVVYRTSVAALEAWLAQHSFIFVEARDRPGLHPLEQGGERRDPAVEVRQRHQEVGRRQPLPAEQAT